MNIVRILTILVGAFLLYFGLSSFPWPKKDRHKKHLALGCMFLAVSGFLGILFTSWIILVVGAVLGFGIVMLYLKLARNPRTMARDVTFVYETLRKSYQDLFDSEIDIVYAAAMIYLQPYIKVGKLTLLDIKSQLSGLMDIYAGNLDCPGFFNGFALSLIKISELADGLTEEIAEGTIQSSSIVVDDATKTTRYLMEADQINLPKWHSKIKNALASPELAELLINRS
ncbi:MAG: hypothetical protein WCE45_06175 [Sedimentisphaerales bacterium]